MGLEEKNQYMKKGSTVEEKFLKSILNQPPESGVLTLSRRSRMRGTVAGYAGVWEKNCLGELS